MPRTTGSASSRGARSRAACSAARTSDDTARRKSVNPRYEALRPQLDDWEKLCAELGEEPAAVALGVAAAARRA